jgi:hypothetical protein
MESIGMYFSLAVAAPGGIVESVSAGVTER